MIMQSGRVLLLSTLLALTPQVADATFMFGLIGSVNSTKLIICFISLFALIVMFEFVTGLIDYRYVMEIEVGISCFLLYGYRVHSNNR